MSDARKICFEVEISGLREVESLWARATDEGFVLDNIPFYAGSVSCEDVVRGEMRDGQLWFAGLVRAGGHSTVRMQARVRAQLREMGCPSEGSDLPGLVAVDTRPTRCGAAEWVA